MSNNFTIKKFFPVRPEQLYNAWLDSDMHSDMTGGSAECTDKENEEFTAWDGYISGRNIKLVQYSKIVQSWRTSDFKHDDLDSELILDIEGTDQGSVLTLTHNNIPDGQPNYEQGWMDHYFNPMSTFFELK